MNKKLIIIGVIILICIIGIFLYVDFRTTSCDSQLIYTKEICDNKCPENVRDMINNQDTPNFFVIYNKDEYNYCRCCDYLIERDRFGEY